MSRSPPRCPGSWDGSPSVPPRGSHWSRRRGRSPPGWVCGGHGWWVGGQGLADKESVGLIRSSAICSGGRAGAALLAERGLVPGHQRGAPGPSFIVPRNEPQDLAPAAPLGTSQAHGVPPHWLCRGIGVGAPTGWDEEPDLTPPPRAARAALGPARGGIRQLPPNPQSCSHPTEEVTPPGHSSCPSVPPSPGCAVGTALLLLAAPPAVSSVPGTAP